MDKLLSENRRLQKTASSPAQRMIKVRNTDFEEHPDTRSVAPDAAISMEKVRLSVTKLYCRPADTRRQKC